MKKSEKDKLNTSGKGDEYIQKQPDAGKDKISFPGYPVYPSSEDIYNKSREEDLDPEDISKRKDPGDEPIKQNEKDINRDKTGNDLDVPGSELDDELEKVGSEDEENNYYSLGGENHNDLDEDKGE